MLKYVDDCGMRRWRYYNRAQYADLRGNIKENAFILGKDAVIGRK
jgi:hypothetical protein